MEFSFDQLSDNIYSSIKKIGFTEPTEIQKQTIPILLNSSTDLVGQAQTGTGKTAAFCLPLLEKLDFKKRGLQAVILSPTRELANQINQELIKFGADTPLKTVTVYGGVGYKDQLTGLRTAHVVIATPGRAIDLLKREKLNLTQCDYFIIDEADEMLKMGFIEDVDVLLDELKPSANKWMFSATMPKPIIRLIEKKLNKPEFVQVKKETLSNKNITQSYTYLHRKDFFKALKTILLTEGEFYGIVFCETREETKVLADKLLAIGKRAAALHGDLNQNQRDNAMALFKARKINILVCTDVAARGLDVTNVTHVINMGLPRKPDSYVHRIGRTGRAGNYGKAISFVPPNESRSLKNIENLINERLEKFEVPKASLLKNNKINYELDRMGGIKKALLDRQKEFSIDPSYNLFNDFLSDMNREDIIKLLFSYQFKKDLKEIDEAIFQLSSNIVSVSQPKRKNQSGHGGGAGAGRKRQRRGRQPRRRH